MNSQWTQERRDRQAQAIRRWKPWERSTGPSTPEGKVKAARNAYKGSPRQNLRELSRLLRMALREQEAGLDDLSESATGL